MSSDSTHSDAETTPTGSFAPVEHLVERIQDSASVDRVFGDPITAEGRTLVPVARVAYGFGGGFGSGDGDEDGEGGEGGGVGGGVDARPLGVLEVTDAETRFVRFTDWRRTALAVGVGLVLGLLLGRRTRGE
ncbi:MULTISPECIES: spore germination protein GerW family protein [Salinibaculum]|uniref:spore germination protein GerW family protein n=1 Tax=Salinibaculum TaxID=2732368 RepID=UPI0030D322BA